ncbi:MAG: tRNA (adenosine(37)-N6)-threonylcarbamoyltransferase complex ATPase subunit type 1 TsaE [Oscillospiraceae bacterium]|jgi:tRNA threonylcarbamoyladenosine biosynthesis protein TsaE|nr:tRNA (adenosine(37)-N6)-threonylcarbamoyltransferase complex ATPase subunit type 1 TsaE [Oscillospiraceae bacterium]
MTVITNGEDETQALGSALAAGLRRGCVVALTGGLGAGKTAFVRGIAAGLKNTSRVTSPTFTVVNEYPGEIPLFHFDFYRLSGARELFGIGWDDYLDRGGVVAAEWSDIAPELIPEDAVRVDIEYLGDNARRVTLEAGDGSEVMF